MVNRKAHVERKLVVVTVASVVVALGIDGSHGRRGDEKRVANHRPCSRAPPLEGAKVSLEAAALPQDAIPQRHSRTEVVDHLAGQKKKEEIRNEVESKTGIRCRSSTSRIPKNSPALVDVYRAKREKMTGRRYASRDWENGNRVAAEAFAVMSMSPIAS